MNIILSDVIMYRIKLIDYKIQVVCEKCYKNGEVNPQCTTCGGKGVHNKAKQKWIVSDRLCEVEKINRDQDGVLRYWTDESCYYLETERLVHFTFKDALKEAERRNKLM